MTITKELFDGYIKTFDFKGFLQMETLYQK